MASKGLPNLLLILSIIVWLAGGLLVLLDYKGRWETLAIAAFLIPTTLVFQADFYDRL